MVPPSDLPTTSVVEIKFKKHVLKLYKALYIMEKHKHLEPSMSNALMKLSKTLYQEYKKDTAGGGFNDYNSTQMDQSLFAEQLSAS